MGLFVCISSALHSLYCSDSIEEIVAYRPSDEKYIKLHINVLPAGCKNSLNIICEHCNTYKRNI